MPEVLGEGFKRIEDKARNGLQGMREVRLVVINEDDLAAGNDASQQCVNDLVFVIRRNLVKQEIAAYRIVEFTTGLRRIGEPDRCLREIAKFAPAALNLDRRDIEYLQSPPGADATSQSG